MNIVLAQTRRGGILPRHRRTMVTILAQSFAIASGLCVPSLAPADDFVAVDLGTNPDSVVAFDTTHPWSANPQLATAMLAGNYTRGIDFDSSTSGYIVHTAALLGSPTGLYRFHNGTTTLIAQLPSLTENDCGLTLTPDLGTLYFSLGLPHTDDLLFRCTTQGLFQQIAPLHRVDGVATDVIGLAMGNDGVLYGMDTADDSLVAINPATGTTVRIGSFGVPVGGAGELDFDGNTGRLIMAADQIATHIFEVNTTTGAATLLGDLPFVTSAIAFAVDLEPVCPDDLDNGSGTGVGDGAVNISDLLFYLTQFGLGAPQTDLDNGTGTGIADGAVNIDDLLYFLFRFEAGC